MGIKYSMEGLIKYKKINAVVTRSKGSQITMQAGQEESHITVADDNMQDQHCSITLVSRGTIKLMYI